MAKLLQIKKEKTKKKGEERERVCETEFRSANKSSVVPVPLQLSGFQAILSCGKTGEKKMTRKIITHPEVQFH